jgi:hypothetical protein
MFATSPVAERPVDPARLDRHLLVAWQHPSTRAFDLVGRLDVPVADDKPYRFAYYRHAASVAGFRPFVDLPNLDRVYEAHDLFPLFENRLTPRSRADFPEVAAFVGLTGDADPFEVLARTGGRRATDTVEVVPEPAIDPVSGRLEVDFLVHGIRHHDGVDACLENSTRPIACGSSVTSRIRPTAWPSRWLTSTPATWAGCPAIWFPSSTGRRNSSDGPKCTSRCCTSVTPLVRLTYACSADCRPPGRRTPRSSIAPSTTFPSPSSSPLSPAKALVSLSARPRTVRQGARLVTYGPGVTHRQLRVTG